MKRIMALLLFLSLSWTAIAKPKEVIELNAKNVVFLNVAIDSASTDTFVAAMVGKRVMLDSIDPKLPLYVLIVSGGGEYYASLKIQAALKVIPNITVICKYCASAAGFLFATHKGPRLVIGKSVALLHEMYLQHATAKNVANDVMMEQFVRNSEDFNEAHYSIIGISREEYEKKIVGKEWTIEGEDIVKLHLADKLIIVHCDKYISNIAPDTCSQ